MAALHPGGGNSHVIINYLGKHQCVRNQQITRLRHKVREANTIFGEVNEVLPRKNAKLESIKKKEFQKENYNFDYHIYRKWTSHQHVYKIIAMF